MNSQDKLGFLESELNDQIARYRHKRIRDKNKAFLLKMMTVVLSGLISILLGLKVPGDLADLFKAVALVFGATITVANAIEAFFDHRSLWIRWTVTLARLYDLQSNLKFYVSGMDEAKLPADQLSKFHDQLRKILQDDLASWLRLREERAPKAEGAKR